jgi:hypothetical protein
MGGNKYAQDRKLKGKKAMKKKTHEKDMKRRKENFKIDVPCFCMTARNLTMTLEEGRMRTWRLPAFSALFMALSASLRTEVLTILAV